MGQPTVLFHPIHAPAPGGMLFDSDDLPNLDYGWVDDPRKMPSDPKKIPKAHQVPIEVAIAPQPKSAAETEQDAKRLPHPSLADPRAFDSFEDYMEEFNGRLSTSLTKAQTEEQHKRAIQHYAVVRYNHPLDDSIPLVDMVNAVDVAEGGAAA